MADDGRVALNPGVIAPAGLTTDEVGELARRHAAELARRARDLRGGREPAPLEGRTVVVVDDGMATGATMRVALDVVRRRAPRRLVAAVPVAAPEAAAMAGEAADWVECVATPPDFRAVGPWYGDFTQVSDDEVRRCSTPDCDDVWSPAPQPGRWSVGHPGHEGSANTSASGTGNAWDQFGRSSVVPGRLGRSGRASALQRAGHQHGGRRGQPLVGGHDHVLDRAVRAQPRRPISLPVNRCRASSSGSMPPPAGRPRPRLTTRRPPWAGRGWSWRPAPGPHRPGGASSNHATRIDSTPASCRAARTSGSTVPRSSPTTTAPARMLSTASTARSSSPR